MEIPRRYSLATQAAASIREGILNGTWTDILPSERNLCRFLQISRPTLRAALEILRHDGLIRVRKRQNTQIVPAGLVARPPDAGQIVLLTSKPLHQQAADMISFVGELQLALTRSNLRLVIVEDPHLGKDNPQRFLEKITQERPAVCYVLMRVSEAVQQFFSDLRLPTFIRGSRFPKVRLPSTEWDYLALGRHAAGALTAKGHKRLGLVLPADIRTGDLRCEEGFREEVARRSLDEPVVFRSGARALSLYRKVQKAFDSPDRPSGLFVLNPYDCVTVFFALLNLGLEVPKDVSVLSCETSMVFQSLPFRVASYSARNKLMDKSSKLVLKLALNHFVPAQEYLVMPDFDSGETLGRAGGASSGQRK